MTEPTTERLAKALEALNNPRAAPMIKRAREGHYDDYLSPLAAPISALVKDAQEIGEPAFAQRAIHGEFDGTKEESDAWAASPEGQATFRQLMGGQ